MKYLRNILEDLNELDLEDLKEKYVHSCKMLFALFQSIDEICSKTEADSVYAMFNKLTKLDEVTK